MSVQIAGQGTPLAFAGVERELLESLPDGVVICDSTGRIAFVNRQTESLTGYARKELVGRQIEVLVPESLRSAHEQHWDHQNLTGAVPRPMGSARGDFRLRRADGSEISVDIALNHLTESNKLQIIATIRDISERERLERAK